MLNAKTRRKFMVVLRNMCSNRNDLYNGNGRNKA